MLKAKGLLNYLTSDRADFGKSVRDAAKFAASADARAVTDFFAKCYSLGINAMELAYFTVADLLKAGRDDVVQGLFQASGEGDPIWGVYTAGEALSCFKRFEIVPGARLLGLAIPRCRATLARRGGGRMADMGFLIQNAFLLESVLWPQAKRFPAPRLEILRRGAFSGSPYTCVTICDKRYFSHYARSFIDGLRRACGNISVFLLLVDPDDETIVSASEFDGVTVAATRYGGPWTFEFCVSVRFMLAGEILDGIGGPAVFLDVDSDFREGSAEALSIVARKPLSVCDNGSLFPLLRICGGMLGLRPAPDTYAFLGAAREFLLEDMAREGPLWGLDQMALYRAVCLGREKGWDISDINADIAGIGRAPDMFIKPAGEVIPLDERRAIRTNAFYEFSGFSPDGRMTWAPADGQPRWPI
ncbi:MAG: hypothetical protein LBF92_00550 [Synergistaceae bacterium]|jgi:hypothetical protein|nr:hypothetical protein [Synergistaceae bacterium]